MGKIFGISNNPVSTIETALKPLRIEAPKIYPKTLPKNENKVDKFVSVEKIPDSNAFVKMRNGIGRLMSHFSQAKTKKTS